MDKKILSLILFAFLLISGYVPIAAAHNAPFPGDYNHETVVIDTIGEPETVDPAWCYDTGSGEIIFNVYEGLVFYDLDYTKGPYWTGQMDSFKAAIATDVEILEGPEGFSKTYNFTIRGTDPRTHTFVAINDVVDLFKDGQIYGTKLFVRDPDYGKPLQDIGPIRPHYETPTGLDVIVDRANVPAKQYAGVVGQIVDTTWQDTTANEKIVLISFHDNGDGVVSASDRLNIVRKTRVTRGVIYNVLEWYHVLSVDPGPPYTITAEPEKVYFHNGATLTPEDVEYTFERGFVQDRSGGPTWMLWFPLFNEYGAVPPSVDKNFGNVTVNNALESSTTNFWMYMVNPFPDSTWLQIVAQSWASIMNKAWCVLKGDFDGNWGAGWKAVYDTWHSPSESFVEDDMMGTGPYKFVTWEHNVAWTIEKYDGYWDGWPARVGATGKQRVADSAKTIIEYLLPSWTTRRPRFLAGASDFTAVPRQYRDQLLGQYVGGELIRCLFPIPQQLTVDANFYNFDVNPQSPYLGIGFDPANPHLFGDDRIPVELFSDKHVRQGFTAAFNYLLYLSSAYLNEAVQPADPIIDGLAYDNPAATKPVYDLAKAEAELKQAWIGHAQDDPDTPEGALWDNGMEFVMLYNSGNVPRETAVGMLRDRINEMNEKFHLSTQEVAWGSTYLPQMVAGMLPLFSIGWLLDYADPDNFAYPFMHSTGTFSAWQKYANERVDELISYGALLPMDTTPYNFELDLGDPRPSMNNLQPIYGGTNATGTNIPPDTRWPRRSTYYELQAIYTEDVPGFCLSQPIGRGFQQAWNRGWYYNPIYPGGYFYHRWKAATHFGDTNNDGAVNVLDMTTVSACWTKPSATSTAGPLGYTPQADVTGGTGGTPDAGSGQVVGIPNGKVDVVDSSLVSSYWDK